MKKPLDLTTAQHGFDNFRDIGCPDVRIPNSLRINDYAGPESALVEASRFVRTYNVLQSPGVDLLTERLDNIVGSLCRTTTSGVVRTPLVDADENVMLKQAHGSISFVASCRTF